ncbi:hypothetical protein [Catenulispora pinisilvae]|uniref:hypothetical protein n=1 Tax=Catenulispora pinisilvae TaxID=2705253 RepID=UPI0018910C10|nr:hypothetical protein [Catenulispora pinisilvae]
MTSRVLRALSAFTLFVGAASLLPGSARADTAHADSPAVQVGITGVSPQIPNFANLSEPMTFSGKVANTSSTTLRDIHLEVRRSLVYNRSAMGSTPNGGGGQPDIARVPVAKLAPGTTLNWQFTPKELEFFGSNKPTSGVYAVDIDAFDSDGTFLSGARTYTLWQPKQPEGTNVARLALLWPVVGQPGLTGQKVPNSAADPIVADQSTAQQFAPGGRLDRILDDASGIPVNWLVDPDVLYTANALENGYFYPDKNGKLTGGPATDPTNWYTKATGLLGAGQNCWNLLYGDPDLNTLSRSAAGQDLLNVAAGTNAGVGGCRQSDQVIAWPSDGQADATTLNAIANTKTPSLVPLVGSNAAYSWPSAHAALPNSPNTIVYDNYLSSVFTDPAKATPTLSDTGVLAGQQWLAQTALAARDDTNRALVVVPPRDFDPAPALVSAIKAINSVPPNYQWYGLDNLDRVLSAPATPEHISALTKPATPNAPTAVVQTAWDSQQLYHALHSIMPGHTYDTAVPLRPVATWWRNHGGDQTYAQTVYSAVVADHGLVSFGTQTPPLTMSGKSGTVPVTINNRTNTTIRIYLRAHDEGAHTMELKFDEDQGPHTVDPGQTATVRIPVQARGNGQQVTLSATLYTCEDLSQNCTYYPSNLFTPLKGGFTTVTVKVSRIGIIALALIIGSGLLLILLIGLRVYRAKRAHHAPAQDTMAS